MATATVFTVGLELQPAPNGVKIQLRGDRVKVGKVKLVQPDEQGWTFGDLTASGAAVVGVPYAKLRNQAVDLTAVQQYQTARENVADLLPRNWHPIGFTPHGINPAVAVVGYNVVLQWPHEYVDCNRSDWRCVQVADSESTVEPFTHLTVNIALKQPDGTLHKSAYKGAYTLSVKDTSATVFEKVSSAGKWEKLDTGSQLEFQVLPAKGIRAIQDYQGAYRIELGPDELLLCSSALYEKQGQNQYRDKPMLVLPTVTSKGITKTALIAGGIRIPAGADPTNREDARPVFVDPGCVWRVVNGLYDRDNSRIFFVLQRRPRWESERLKAMEALSQRIKKRTGDCDVRPLETAAEARRATELDPPWPGRRFPAAPRAVCCCGVLLAKPGEKRCFPGCGGQTVESQEDVPRWEDEKGMEPGRRRVLAVGFVRFADLVPGIASAKNPGVHLL